MKNLSNKTSLSSYQKQNELALQPIKACKTFEHFQVGTFKGDKRRIIYLSTKIRAF